MRESHHGPASSKHQNEFYKLEGAIFYTIQINIISIIRDLNVQIIQDSLSSILHFINKY